MSKEKRRGARFELEWITVPYRVLVKWCVSIGGLVLVVVGGYLGMRWQQSGERDAVERLVAAVEREVADARGAHEGSPELGEARALVAEARSELNERDLGAARDAAEGARRKLRALPTRGDDRAQLLTIEGRVPSVTIHSEPSSRTSRRGMRCRYSGSM